MNRTILTIIFLAFCSGLLAQSPIIRGELKRWQMNFVANVVGTWNYTVSFRSGKDIAVGDGTEEGKSLGPDGMKGNLVIADTEPNTPGFLRGGRTVYSGERYLRFSGTGEYFLKKRGR